MKVVNSGKSPLYIVIGEETDTKPLVATKEKGMMVLPGETVHFGSGTAISITDDGDGQSVTEPK